MIITLSLLAAALVAMWALLPDPHRAVTPPPLDEEGFTYTCRCWQDRVKVTILPASRGRHARPRPASPLCRRFRRKAGSGDGDAVPLPATA
ncbi:hypothetical protein [Streptomyces sp. NPDC004296]|uniref:hypothetical protein n=1 Tax=Streptomyces sp. NPDC004296 TaxID=3364697 RepID=UPI0036C72CAF